MQHYDIIILNEKINVAINTFVNLPPLYYINNLTKFIKSTQLHQICISQIRFIHKIRI